MNINNTNNIEYSIQNSLLKIKISIFPLWIQKSIIQYEIVIEIKKRFTISKQYKEYKYIFKKLEIHKALLKYKL